LCKTEGSHNPPRRPGQTIADIEYATVERLVWKGRGAK